MSSAAPAAEGPMPRLTTVQWLIVSIAAIGFCFDIYELLMLPLIFRDAAFELGGIVPTDDAFKSWLTAMIFVPALVGGLFGLVGGYLTDRVGRRRMLMVSILMYAFGAFFSAFATNLWMLLALRCVVFIGICLEFVAAVAWLAELFPHPRQREVVIGWTQAFSSFGGLLVAVAYGLCVDYAANFPAIAQQAWLPASESLSWNGHAPWRYTLMSGLIPAIPLIVIRPFLPESPMWRARKDAGTLRRPSYAELFRPRFRKTTVIVTVMIACSYGAAFGAIQQMPQMLGGVPEIAEKTDAAKQLETPAEKKKAMGQAKGYEMGERANLGKTQEIGGLLGRIALAALALMIAARRGLIRVFLIPGLFLLPAVFWFAPFQGLTTFYVGMFIAGFFTVAQFSFWGNYLPRAYPMWLRGTGAGFAANVGSRILGTSFAAVAIGFAWVLGKAGVESGAEQFAYAAAIIAAFVYGLSLILSFFLPEPRTEEELNE